MNDNIAKAIDHLNYRSETDDTWDLWIPTAKRSPGPVTYPLMERLTNLPPFDAIGTPPRDFDKFIDHVKHAQPDDAVAYENLRKVIHQELAQPLVFRMRSPISSGHNLNVYIVGLDATHNLVGILAHATET